jgi:hypothetical protein
LALPDGELAEWLAGWWLMARTQEKGIPLEHLSPQLAEVIRRETLNARPQSAAWADMLAVQQELARGNRTGAVKMFREGMMRRAVDLVMYKREVERRHKQSERARKSREDELDEVIRGIVKKRADISEPELCAELDRLAQAGHPVIEHIDDHWVYVTPRKPGLVKKIKRSALRGRLSRIKIKLRDSR